MFIDQNFSCYICGKPHGETRGTKLHVDHNHQTNKVRKLLCNHCNHIVGMIEGPRYLKALQYIEEHARLK
ncbi:MAG: hypothetical protein B7Z80_24695 [Rhodospirillales bacterium 20-64-7]|nr:MAG: hypothetical protein B7Z80_24695 [Rhodospirillales bacterium 20-64-7]